MLDVVDSKCMMIIVCLYLQEWVSSLKTRSGSSSARPLFVAAEFLQNFGDFLLLSLYLIPYA
ncbi:hypothetical protein HanPSC8_Chr07g0283381 [Helianthus annuus]|nr:hypothetical protein HanPSC8_Chr07g0283381 [Helianthus annuus]